VERSRITIDLGALRRNATTLSRAASPAELWAVVKADAYGHGALDVAPAALAAGASALCVATAGEGAALRHHVPEARIIVLGPLAAGEAALARESRLEVAVSSPDVPDDLPLHIKVDTGMGRWGLDADGLGEIDPARVIGVMSHFATADEADDAFARAQLERFHAVADRFPGAVRHVANSAATLRMPEARLDAVRCGIALYGLSPFGRDPSEDGLEPVLSWRSSIALVKMLQPGESTGYGRRFVAERATRIGIAPVGYGDGFRRGLTGTDVIVGGRRRPVIGTISMDAFAVELSDGEPGDPVTLIGDGLLAEEHARRLRTINYEITCGIRSDPPRATRSVVDG
jgi:alanine racemase